MPSSPAVMLDLVPLLRQSSRSTTLAGAPLLAVVGWCLSQAAWLIVLHGLLSSGCACSIRPVPWYLDGFVKVKEGFGWS
jgi:hypothetical protein